MTAPRPQYDDATRFLQMWRAGGPWTLTSISPDKKKISTRTFTDEKEVDRWLRNAGAARNVYFTVNPLLRTVNKKPERSDVESMAWLHVDIDPRPGEDLLSEQKRALAMLRDPPENVPPPTIITFSGGGYQGFWKLKDPVIINGDAQAYEDAAGYNRQLELIFGADHCHNVDRIMRLPGTINRPDEKKREKGRTEALSAVIEADIRREYDISQFTAAPKIQGFGDDGFAGNSIRVSGNVARLASVDELPASVPDLCKVVIVQGNDPDDLQRWPSRSEPLFWVVCELIRHGVNDDTIFSIITDPDFGISESVLEKGNGSHRYALHQIERGREHAIDPNLMELNSKHAVIESMGGRCRIISEEEDIVFSRKRISFQTFADFQNRYCHRTVDVPTQNGVVSKPLGKWWVNHPMRRQYDSVVFAPGRDVPNSYNLWKGFAYNSRQGNCDLIMDHIRKNVCQSNETIYQYLMGWMAKTVQDPAQPGHTAIVLRGKQGTGKGVFVKAFGKLFGRHFLQVSDPKHLVGSFNIHLQDCVVLFADEAFYAGDKKHESILKTIVTEETLAFEQKGMDMNVGANYVHLLMASNSEWVVPADLNDRRFVVLDVSDDRMQDRRYFAAIQEQLECGGYEALLYTLLNWDLSEYDVRAMPKTAALQAQKVFSFSAEEEWWYQKLLNGQIFETDEEWPQWVFTTALGYDYTSYVRKWSTNTKSNATRLGAFIKRVIPDDFSLRAQIAGTHEVVNESGAIVSVTRPRIYRLPSLDVCRKIWDESFGGPYDWSDVDIVQRRFESDSLF